MGGPYGACDKQLPGHSITTNNPAAYNASMQELVDAGLLSEIPHSVGTMPYCYFDYASGSAAGGLMVTALEATPPSTTGLSPSCRPFSSSWCANNNSTTQYCLCNPY